MGALDYLNLWFPWKIFDEDSVGFIVPNESKGRYWRI